MRRLETAPEPQTAPLPSQSSPSAAFGKSAAECRLRDDVIVMDKARLQNAPKVQQDQVEDGSSKAWQKKADSYWSQYSSMSPGQDGPTNSARDSGAPR